MFWMVPPKGRLLHINKWLVGNVFIFVPSNGGRYIYCKRLYTTFQNVLN